MCGTGPKVHCTALVFLAALQSIGKEQLLVAIGTGQLLQAIGTGPMVQLHWFPRHQYNGFSV